MGATPQQIEHAIGMFVAHYIPFRAIRAGKQLSDSKGASAAISTEAALHCIQRAMNGFVGPKDIFRNPEAIFRLNEPTKGDSPFDIVLSQDGTDFAVMGMHFKLGLYEHQSAGALEAIMKLLYQHKFVEHNNIDIIENIDIVCYEPAFGIIGDPAKRTPTTRQSADHSMVYIISTLLRKAFEDPKFNEKLQNTESLNQVWTSLMLEPQDYSYPALYNKTTRALMEKTGFTHGGKEYDEKYPEGIPTSVKITLKGGKVLDSSLQMFPSGHARNTECDLSGILSHKFRLLGQLALATPEEVDGMVNKLQSLETLSNDDLQTLYNCNIKYHNVSVDDDKFNLVNKY
ncbi:MmgE/PrpD [Pseudocohnilembus persalinus]|uniref:MmgE/PrpD n=1 Tax=Pseudocohnilembus persalinus TaxID=266149 RepID=A0A0V0QCM4_PSEPJ|nr:MmgE/PrpD [Pseudocohnilembus persalinus]|eukprot:KRW99981.1 MmgE/PrpD [Pseudocohnilembus persalinus]